MFNSRREVIIHRHRRKSKIKSSKMKSLLPKFDYLREFSSITSLHGIMYLGEPNRPLLERIFWLGVMSLVIILCGLQIYQLCENWFKGITILTLNTDKYKVFNYPFPAVTFCSDIQLQNVNNRSFEDDLFRNETDDSINLLCYQFELLKNVSLQFINSKNLQRVIVNHKIACSKMISRLFWLQDEIQSPCDYIQPIITTYGLCYSLNMMSHHHLYNTNFFQTYVPIEYYRMSFLNHSLADIMIKTNQTVWTPETGYNKNSTPFDVPWRVEGGAVENSVKILFNLENTNLDSYCPKTDSGITLFLHSPADIPIGLQPTAYVSGSSLLSISLTMSILRTSSKIRKWAPNARNCYFQNERQLKFFKIYSQHNCETECKANNTLNQCHCNAFYQPRDPNVPVCGSINTDCVRKSLTIGYSIFDPLINLSNNILDNCHCMPSCVEFEYDYEIVESFKNWTKNTTSMQLSEDSSLVMIYFKNKNVVDIRKAPLMSFNELIGNIGGLLGLFLGCSIVSVFEILYFFVIRLYFDWQDRKKTKSKIIPSFIQE